MNNYSLIKRLFLSAAFLLFSFNALSNQNCADVSCQSETGTFVLNLWAPGEDAPEDANYAEWGEPYQYQYNPETVEFNHNETRKIVKFRFHPDLAERYQFRWVTASDPSAVTFEKMKDGVMKIEVDAYASDLYFEVWVFDTVTGQRFMCDPKVKVGGGIGQ